MAWSSLTHASCSLNIVFRDAAKVRGTQPIKKKKKVQGHSPGICCMLTEPLTSGSKDILGYVHTHTHLCLENMTLFSFLLFTLS